LSALLTTIAGLDGAAPHDARTAARSIEARLSVPPASLSAIVALAGVPEIPSNDADRLFQPYLAATERLVEYVDSWRS
jgi:hypothetical protein